MQQTQLEIERASARAAQERLLTLINGANALSESRAKDIDAILADAWEELRLRPTSISPMELEQLAIDVDRYTVSRAFAENMARRAKVVIDKPFFARIDFAEAGEPQAKRIAIGLMSLSDSDGDLMVHDWRAPICSLYYEGRFGDVSYESPDGTICGALTCKRSYRFENGSLEYYYDSEVNVDDERLLEILSENRSGQMRQIVATIQSEQNAAVRAAQSKVAAVIGPAGSGKSDVALHRAAYLLFRGREAASARRMRMISPSTAFSEYTANVLPELGEEAIPGVTMYALVKKILGKDVETPARAQQRLLTDDVQLRTASVAYKTSKAFSDALERALEHSANVRIDLAPLRLEGKTIFSADDLQRALAGLSPNLTAREKRDRLRAQLEKRVAAMEEKLADDCAQMYQRNHDVKTARQMGRLTAANRMRPLRSEIRRRYAPGGTDVMTMLLRDAPTELVEAYRDNLRAGLIWWEDAVIEAYVRLRTGQVAPERGVTHVLVDEAQDYSDVSLKLLGAYYPNANVTLLGDVMQRTTPGMPDCTPEAWAAAFGVKVMPVYRLTRCYRMTEAIANFCNRLLPAHSALESVRKGGAPVEIARFDVQALRDRLDALRAEGFGTIAVVTRDGADACRLSSVLEGVYRLDGGDADENYAANDNIVACYHMTKGLEFDAVIVVWRDGEATADEKRRLYTACTRALHHLTVFFEGEAGELSRIVEG